VNWREGRAYRELWWFMWGTLAAVAGGLLLAAMWSTNPSFTRQDATASLVCTLALLALITIRPVRES
jgi:hypothetical protein